MCYDEAWKQQISILWTDIQREFRHCIATSVEQEEKDRLGTSMEDYRTRYKAIQMRALQITAPLYNIMEKERADRDATRGPVAGTGGGGRMAPKVDKSLRPQFKAAFSLSLDEFRRWVETAMSWGQVSGHDQRPALVQKVYFESICEKEFFENFEVKDTYQPGLQQEGLDLLEEKQVHGHKT